MCINSSVLLAVVRDERDLRVDWKLDSDSSDE